MKSSSLSRTQILSVFILFFALVMIAKLFSVQIVHSKTYREMADRQYATPSSDIFERGTIFFENKDGKLISAGTQMTGFKLAIVPKDILDTEDTYNKISKIIELDRLDFQTKATKKSDPYEEVADKLTKEEADAISTLKISGVKVFKEKWRFYPADNMASHTLGFVAYKNDDLGGRYGIERQYDSILSRGEDTPYVNFFAEVFTNIKDTLFNENEKNGDVVTTIEPTVQDFLEKKLTEVKERYSVDSIGGIIMNPTDGEIYSLAVKPDFDLNNFSKVKNASTFGNPIVENILEFGSVMKPIIMASALDLGLVTANTKYTDKGSVIVEKKEIFNFDKKGRGPGTTMQEVLNQSLNTGMVFVYQKLGKENMREYMYSFGIKEKTGIDLPNETGSLTSNLQSPREIEYANASFGQGIALTPVQMVRALSALSNGGYLVTPHIVKKIKYNDGTEKIMTYEKVQTKIKPETSDEITRMLVGAMDQSLKGGTAKFEHHSVAIKTGTAQVADLDNGGYYEDRHTHSFFGYFPAYDPKFIVFLYAVNPKGVPYASVTWADPFLDITKFLLNYYQVPPDR